MQARPCRQPVAMPASCSAVLGMQKPPSRQALVGGPQLLQRQALLLRLRHRGALLPAACAVVDAVAPALAGAVGEHRAAASTAGGLLGTETADMQSRIFCNPMLGREPL